MRDFTRRGIVAGLAALPLASAANAARPKRDRKRKAVVPHVDVAIIGAGVLGAWTAWHLVRSGRSVRLFDAYGVGHARAASGADSRTVTLDHADPLYAAMAKDSLPYWQTLSATASQPVFTPSGALRFGPDTQGDVARSIAALRQSSAAHESGDATWLQRRYPQLRFYQGESGVLDSAGGVLAGGRAVQEVVADAGITPEIIVMPAPLKRPRDGKYQLPDGGTAGALVYACGGWLPEIFPRLLGPLVRVARGEEYLFGTGQGDRNFMASALPAFTDFNRGQPVHGTPDVEGAGFKLRFAAPGPRTDPDGADRLPGGEGIAAARLWMKERMPAMAMAPLIGASVSQYDSFAGGDFLIDRLPGHDRVWLVGGSAAHGFMLAPAVGKRVAQHLAGGNGAVEPRISLGGKVPVY